MLNATRYRMLDKMLIDVADAVVLLTQPEVKKKSRSVRLEVNPHSISVDSIRNSSVVTAHDLRQYRKHIHTVQLEENYSSWLEELLEAGRMEVSGWN